jgi:hypothetical protein
MITVSKLALPFTVPLNPWNWLPAFAVAVIVTGAPPAYQPPLDAGFTVTVPFPDTAVVSRYLIV